MNFQIFIYLYGMEYNGNFKTDLVFGQEGEKRIANKIFDRPVESIEVKEDRKTNGTGNIYIEYESRGKASGIATTEAEVLIYAVEGFPGGMFFYTKELREIVEYLKDTHTRKGGDNDTSLGILINVAELFKFSIRRKELLKSLLK